MSMSLSSRKAAAVGGLLLAGSLVTADGTRFSDFTPLTDLGRSHGRRSEPITFGNPAFQQSRLPTARPSSAAGEPNTGNWDMNTVNETGRAQGPLPVHRVRDRPVRRAAPRPADGRDRDDLAEPGSPEATSRSMPATGRRGARSSPPRRAGSTDAGGFHQPLRPPVRAEEPARPRPASSMPLAPTSNDGADFVHQNVIPRTSHEGIQFDKAGNMYFIDELNGGSIYRYTPARPCEVVIRAAGRLLRRRPDLRAAGRRRQHAERHRRLHLGAVHGRQRRRASRAR